MSHPLLIKTAEYPYHITARANNQEWFYLQQPETWKILCKNLTGAQKKYNLEIHAFVMMNNHIHLLCSTPKENIDKAMHYFMMMTSKEIGRSADRINRIWGARYHRSIISTEKYYAHAFRYLYSNPIRSQIANSISNYRWSTFIESNYKNLNSDLIITPRVGFDKYIPEKTAELAAWINSEQNPSYNEYVRRALRKVEFKFSNTGEVKKYGFFESLLPTPKR